MTVPPSAAQPAPPSTQPCAACAAPLVDGQRYCLQCGEGTRTQRRVLPEAPRLRTRQAHVAASTPADGERWTSPAALLAGLACLLLAMGVGVLIGRGAGGSAAAPAPVTVAAAPAAGAVPAAATFASDWPAGKQGWTVALEVVPKASTQAGAIEAAKAAATSAGAPAVGALDSDDYASLTAGSYVVYSGVLDTQKAAKAALAPLKAKFPDARVTRVGSDATTATSAASRGGASKAGSSKRTPESTSGGSDTSKAFEKSKKAPKTVGTGGKPPPKDNKPAAGGGGFEEIG